MQVFLLYIKKNTLKCLFYGIIKIIKQRNIGAFYGRKQI